MMWKDIAVIGMSGEFPGADSIEMFRKILRSGSDQIGPVPSDRVKMLRMDPDQSYLECGYRSRIDDFDYAGFGISKGEADLLDPQRRRLLEHAWRAVESAGLRRDRLSATRTAVVLSAGDSGYADYLNEDDGLHMMANHPGMIAGHISHCFNFHGPSVVLNTTCSSSLFAVYEACKALIYDEADLALAGGASVFIRPKASDEMDFSASGVVSSGMRCRSFDDSADGTGIGEGVGIVVLKRLEQAVLDGDPIWAVIRGGAANHCGERSNSLVAPSPEAQRDVLLQAWAAAHADPGQIEMIEAHGTGTKIGDPIEAEGLRMAFCASGIKRQTPCALTALKSNIGHLNMAAGVASFIKTVLSIRYGEIYPIVHFKKGNRLIPWGDIPLRPVRQLEFFQGPERLAGVTALGLSGTNVHLLLGAQPGSEPACAVSARAVQQSPALCPDEPPVICLSARDEQRLNAYRRELADWIESESWTAEKWMQFSDTLLIGRDYHTCRYAARCDGPAALIARLRSDDSGGLSVLSDPKPYGRLYVLMGGQPADHRVIEAMADRLMLIRPAAKTAAEQPLPGDPEAAALRSWIRHWKRLLRLLEDWTQLPVEPVGVGGTNLLVESWRGSESCDTERYRMYAERPFDRSAFDRFVRASAGDAFWLALGGAGPADDRLAELPVCRCLCADALLERLFVAGILNPSVDFVKNTPVRRCYVPSDPFRPVSCWVHKDCRQCPAPAAVPAIPAAETPAEAVGAAWASVLGLPAADPDADFFDLGGNSIIALKLIQMLQRRFGPVIELSDIYRYSTAASMAAYIGSQTVSEQMPPDMLRPETDPYWITPVPAASDYEPSDAQKRMWIMNSHHPDSIEYNMPGVMITEGPLDVDRMERVFQNIVQIHDGFRSRFELVDNALRVFVEASVHFKIDRYEMTEPEAQVFKQTYIRPFDLTKAPLLRIAVIKIAENRHLTILDMHHIISDGTSMGIVGREFLDGYAGKPLSPPPVQYRDFAAWQHLFAQTAFKRRQDDYWRAEAADLVDNRLHFPLDFARPVKRTDEGDLYTFEVPGGTVDALKRFGAAHKVTMNALLMSFYLVVMAQATRERRVVCGMPISGRRSSQLDRVTGMFVNMLILKLDVDPDEAYRDFLRRLRDKQTEVMANQDTQLTEIIEMLDIVRKPNRHPLFDTVFVLQEIELPDMSDLGLKIHYSNEDRTAKFDLVFSGYHRDGALVFTIRYWNRLYRAGTVRQMADSFQAVLSDVLKNPEQPVGRLGAPDPCSDGSAADLTEAWDGAVRFHF